MGQEDRGKTEGGRKKKKFGGKKKNNLEILQVSLLPAQPIPASPAAMPSHPAGAVLLALALCILLEDGEPGMGSGAGGGPVGGFAWRLRCTPAAGVMQVLGEPEQPGCTSCLHIEIALMLAGGVIAEV